MIETDGQKEPTTEAGKRLTTWVSFELADYIETIAKAEDRSVSQVVSRIIRAAYEAQKEAA